MKIINNIFRYLYFCGFVCFGIWSAINGHIGLQNVFGFVFSSLGLLVVVMMILAIIGMNNYEFQECREGGKHHEHFKSLEEAFDTKIVSCTIYFYLVHICNFTILGLLVYYGYFISATIFLIVEILAILFRSVSKMKYKELRSDLEKYKDREQAMAQKYKFN